MMSRKLILWFVAASLTTILVACGDFIDRIIYKDEIIYFESNGGTQVNSITTKYGSTIPLPSTSRSGYNFDGWYSSSSGGTLVGGAGDNYAVNNSVTLYAQWKNAEGETYFTISFNAQGGSSVPEITKLSKDTTIALPSTNRNGYTFDGWYSSSLGGTRVGEAGGSYVVSCNATLYAQWTIIDNESGTTKNINGIECVLVKAGTFIMGANDLGYTEHKVTVTRNYWVSKYEVTQRQYKAVMGTNPSYLGYGISDNYPVNNVDWNDADAFCKAVGGRLPTEAEWEFAARSGNRGKGQIYSGSNNLDTVGWYYDNSGYTSHPIGTKLPNQLGIYDMSGNVREWCSDWYDSYKSDSVNDPKGPVSGSYRINRGGSWDYDSQYCRVTNRTYNSPSYRDYHLGFRIVFGDTVYVDYLTVSFDVQGGTSADVIMALQGAVITLPFTTKTGYTFNGWYSSISGGTRIGGTGDNYVVNGSITLYAQWMKIFYKVSFDAQGGTSVNSINNVSTGSIITLPSTSRNNYTFNGWYSSSSYGTRVGGAGDNYVMDVVYKDVTFYAQWTNTLYNVLFDVQGGTSVNPMTVQPGAAITLPSTSRNGYTFNGWYLSSSGGTLVGRAGNSYVVNGNVTLYALWTQNGNDGDTKIISGIECILVKAGTFMMGSPTSDTDRYSDETQHQVTITKDYWIGKYPVTQAQFKAVMGYNPSNCLGDDDRPVETLSWSEAVSFCNAVSGRLLTEAEWEFAARGGNKSNGYKYSGSNNLNDVGWYKDNTSGPKPVGTKAPNELGIYDMSGNVFEWCSDWYGSYSSSSQTDPKGPGSGLTRVNRGGSWVHYSQYCRVASRHFDDPPPYHKWSLGFRVAFNKN